MTKISQILAKIGVGSLLALISLTQFSPANALTSFNFSFSNEDGAVNGTVEGVVTLPDGDGTFAATGLISCYAFKRH